MGSMHWAGQPRRTQLGGSARRNKDDSGISFGSLELRAIGQIEGISCVTYFRGGRVALRPVFLDTVLHRRNWQVFNVL